jgi:FGGY family of carbohydrate kinases, C-terminal domain
VSPRPRRLALNERLVTRARDEGIALTGPDGCWGGRATHTIPARDSDPAMLTQFDELAAEAGVGRRLAEILPMTRLAGELTEAGDLFASLATLRIGMDVLQKDEGVRLDRMFAHGGLFSTKGVAERFLAAAINTPVSVGDAAAEGGAWGIAVLAAYLIGCAYGQTLDDYLNTRVFADTGLETTEKPDPADVAGFGAFIQAYLAALPVERAAVEHT